MSVKLEKLQLENIVRYFAGRAKEMGLQMPVGGPNSSLDGPTDSEEALVAYKLRLVAWIEQVVVPTSRKGIEKINEAVEKTSE
jgi:hypothetical protein